MPNMACYRRVDKCCFTTDIILNIIHYKSNSIRKYKISHEELMVIANKKHWIHSLDDFNTDNIIEEQIDYKTLYENSQKELEQLNFLNLHQSNK